MGSFESDEGKDLKLMRFWTEKQRKRLRVGKMCSVDWVLVIIQAAA